jgi:hypothetical protein
MKCGECKYFRYVEVPPGFPIPNGICTKYEVYVFDFEEACEEFEKR